jgi:hypothetical protein
MWVLGIFRPTLNCPNNHWSSTKPEPSALKGERGNVVEVAENRCKNNNNRIVSYFKSWILCIPVGLVSCYQFLWNIRENSVIMCGVDQPTNDYRNNTLHLFLLQTTMQFQEQYTLHQDALTFVTQASENA